MSTRGVIAPIELAKGDIFILLQWLAYDDEGLAHRLRRAAEAMRAGVPMSEEELFVLVGTSGFVTRLHAADKRKRQGPRGETVEALLQHKVRVWNVRRVEAVAAWLFFKPIHSSVVDTWWDDDAPRYRRETFSDADPARRDPVAWPPHFSAISRLLLELARVVRGRGRPMDTARAWRWVQRYKHAHTSWEKWELRKSYASAIALLQRLLDVDEAQAIELADTMLEPPDDLP